MQGGGTTAGTVGGQAALMSGGLSLGSALMYGGLGSLGYSLLGGALGLPQNKYSGITSGLGAGLGAWGASAALSGTALGATLGSAVPVVGTVIGAALGGLASSLFGGGKKTHPSVYTNVVDASLFGSDWEALMTQGAWTDRASVSDAAEIFKGLGEVASTTADSILSFAQALPEQYRDEIMTRLNAETVSFGRGSTAGRSGVTDYGPSTWNFQFHDEEQLQEVIDTAGEDIQRVMFNALQRAMTGVDMSDMFSSIDVSSSEGLQRAMSAISTINSITDAIDAIKNPSTEAEQQAETFMSQVEALRESVKGYGVSERYASQLVEQYRAAYVDSYVAALDELFSPLSDIETQAKSYKETIDGYVKALTTMGASEAQLAKVRGYWEYYFRPLEMIVDQAVTDIPISPVATLEVTLTQKGGPALGHIVAGQTWFIGMTQYNTRLGIRDYSRKDTDEFGNTRLVKRANAKRTSLPLFLRPSRLDTVREILARMHGLPALWLGDDHEGVGSYQSLTVWGWLEDWNATVIGPDDVNMTIDIQGLK